MKFYTEIPSELAEKLLTFRSLAQKAVSYLMSSLLAVLMLYFGQQLFWRSLFTSPTELFFYFVYLPLLLNYAIIGTN